MPIYKYNCEKCGSQVEVIQKVSDPPLKRCAKCRGKLAKAVSRTSFQLKAGARHGLCELPAAFRASLKGRIAYFLDDLDLGAALLTIVFVDGHTPPDSSRNY